MVELAQLEIQPLITWVKLGCSDHPGIWLSNTAANLTATSSLTTDICMNLDSKTLQYTFATN